MAGPWEDFAPTPSAPSAPPSTTPPWEDFKTKSSTAPPWEDFGGKAAEAPAAPSGAGALKVFGEEAASTALGMPGQALMGVGTAVGQFGNQPIEEGAIYRTGQALDKYSKTWGADEKDIAAHPIAAGAGQAVGSVGGVVPALVAGGVAGGPLGAGAAGAAMFSAAGAGETFNAAKLKGVDDLTASKAAGLSAIVNGGLGALPLGAILAPVRGAAPGLTGWATATLEKALRAGVVFATVGEAQEFLGRQIAKAYYDPQAGYSPDVNRVLGNLIGGGIVGTVTPRMIRHEEVKPPPPEMVTEVGKGVTAEIPPVVEPVRPEAVPETPRAPEAPVEAPARPVEITVRGKVYEGATPLEAFDRALEEHPDLTQEEVQASAAKEDTLSAIAERNGGEVPKDVERVTRDLERGAIVEDEHGRTIVNGREVSRILPEEAEKLAPARAPLPKIATPEHIRKMENALKLATVEEKVQILKWLEQQHEMLAERGRDVAEVCRKGFSIK